MHRFHLAQQPWLKYTKDGAVWHAPRRRCGIVRVTILFMFILFFVILVLVASSDWMRPADVLSRNPPAYRSGSTTTPSHTCSSGPLHSLIALRVRKRWPGETWHDAHGALMAAFNSPNDCQAPLHELADPTSALCSQFFSFFADRNASAWEMPHNLGSRSSVRMVEHLRRLQVDVVYTYVSPTSRSFQRFREEFLRGHEEGSTANTFTRTRTTNETKGNGFNLQETTIAADTPPLRIRIGQVRDFGELRYSLRNLFTLGLRSPAFASWNGVAEGALRPVLRNVFLVVADVDQIPPWLNQSFPLVRPVAIAELIRPRETFAMPTFNSFAIETLLHRIPDLSRHFIYFNNDMLWGRYVSLFDYFCPLSCSRQRAVDAVWADPQSSTSTWPEERDDELVFFLEPRLRAGGYSFPHGLLSTSGCRRGGSDGIMKSACCLRGVGTADCFVSQCLQDMPSTTGDTTKRMIHLNRMEVVDMLPGVLPVYTFAHLPILMDRVLVGALVDDAFRDSVERTRRHQIRQDADFWLTYVYPYFALWHRRLGTESLTRFVTEISEKAHQLPFTVQNESKEKHFEAACALHQKMCDARHSCTERLLSSFWGSAREENPLPPDVESQFFSANYHFHMIDSTRKALVTAARLQTFRPLFITFNDHFSETEDETQKREMLWAMTVVLEVASRGVPPAPWEAKEQ